MLRFLIQIAIIDPRSRPFFLVGFPFLVYCFLGAPLVAALVARRLTGERDFLADGEAVLLTRNPVALGTALEKLSASGLPVVPAGAATAHLWFVPPRQLGGHWWQMASLAMGPPVAKRIDRVLQLGPFGSES
jgi:heat shock protein HtpX